MEILEIIDRAVAKQASDIHLVAEHVPVLRINGELIACTEAGILKESALQKFLHTILPNEKKEAWRRLEEADFAFHLASVARIRAHAFRQLHGLSIALRVLPLQLPTLAEVQAPEILKSLGQLTQGLVLITGPTGCGKTTTAAAWLNEINHQQKKHIITLEDPIEYVHPPQQSLIQQRQVGIHTPSFAHGLRAALREDPDILLIGELRDLETIRLAITAAETGHLVIATLHTVSAVQTLHRMIDVFTGDEKTIIRELLAETLQAVISQKLVRQPDGSQQARHEILLTNPAVKNLIREGKVSQLYSVMQTSEAQGMRVFKN